MLTITTFLTIIIFALRLKCNVSYIVNPSLQVRPSLTRNHPTKVNHLQSNKDSVNPTRYNKESDELHHHKEIADLPSLQINNRRSFLTTTVVTAVSGALLNQPKWAYGEETEGTKILVLGGTGLVGSEICRQLKSRGIKYVATSRDGRDNTKAFDALKSDDIVKDIKALCQDCTGIISTIGSISNTSDDYVVNSSSGYAAIAAKEMGIKHFVYISVSPDVRDSVKGLGVLGHYMSGKVFSESTIQSQFDSSSTSYCIIQPTFIYGGEKFGINPPRVTKSYGSLVENVLSSSLFRSLESISPGLISVALKPPIPVEAVASAAIVGALGKTNGPSSIVLDSYDSINAAAALL